MDPWGIDAKEGSPGTSLPTSASGASATSGLKVEDSFPDIFQPQGVVIMENELVGVVSQRDWSLRPFQYELFGLSIREPNDVDANVDAERKPNDVGSRKKIFRK